MKKVSVFRLPILWMLLGPPAFRMEVRDAMASVREDVDIWNLLRIAWWLFWGCVAVVELLRSRNLVLEYLSRIGRLSVWALVWLIALVVSAAVSPSSLFTLANAVMFSMLVLAAADLGVKLYAGAISPRRLLRLVVTCAVLLLTLVGIVYMWQPAMVRGSGEVYTGVRIRGENIAYTPILAQFALFVGVYFLLTARGIRRLVAATVVSYGFWWLLLAQTRSAYLGVVLGSGLLVWQWGDLGRRPIRLTAAVALIVLALAGAFWSYDMSDRVQWRLDNAYERYVLRDEFAVENPELASESLRSLNGRIEAQAVLLREAVMHPLGMGYIAGTRSYMDSVMDELPGTAFRGAHNAYLETFAGGGYAAFLGFAAVALITAASLLRCRTPVAVIMGVLLACIFVEGFFENEMVFPFHQSAVLFWTLVASASALSAWPNRAQAVASFESSAWRRQNGRAVGRGVARRRVHRQRIPIKTPRRWT